MRKAIFLLLAGTFFVIPFVTLADTGGEAQATLTFESVISTIVQDNWDPMTITQGDIVGLAGQTALDWEPDAPAGGNTITVTVYSLTQFNVYASYYDANGLVNADGFLILTEGADSYALVSYQVSTPQNHGLTDTQASANLTELTHWNGEVNIDEGGESHTYTVQWNPSLLPDLKAGDVLNLSIFFVVTDPTI